jgi:hypothetical protein
VGFVADCHQDSDGPGRDPTTCEIVRKKWIEERSDDTKGLFQSACRQPMAALCFGSIPAAMAPSDIQPHQNGVALTTSPPARAPYSTRIWGCPRTSGGSICLPLAYGKPRGPTIKIGDQASDLHFHQ